MVSKVAVGGAAGWKVLQNGVQGSSRWGSRMEGAAKGVLDRRMMILSIRTYSGNTRLLDNLNWGVFKGLKS